MDLFSKKKKKEELAQAHEDFSDMLLRRAFFKVHNKGLSEDLVQETFLKTWKYIIKGGEISTMKAFLYHILNNLIIDEYRKQRNQASSLDHLTDSGFDISTEEHTHRGESIDLITATEYINQLPEKYKNVVHMKIILSMSTEEIAHELKRTKNNVTVQIHRGLKHIQLLHKKRSQGQNKKISSPK